MDYLRVKGTLLILDNCEHLIETCAALADQLLQACPRLKIIASSREALNIPGETVYRVPPLSLPENRVAAESLLTCESGRLFVERATQAEPRFKLTDHNASAIAQICLRLDGIPLALELAAARVKLFTPEQIARRLDDRFRLLSGGSRTALPRQQTLRALIDWSYQTLDAKEQDLFRRLAVFSGGWTFEAAEAVAGESQALDSLLGLVNKSLVNVEEQADQSRYHFLETIRQYALEKLVEAGQDMLARDRHLEYFLDYADQPEPSTFSLGGPGRLDQLEREHDNLRAALEWGTQHHPAKALQLARLMSGMWTMHNYYLEARAWCEKILARTEDLPFLDSARAEVFETLGWIATLQGDHQAGRAASQGSLHLAREVNDKKTIVRALNSLAFSALFLGDFETATAAAIEGEAIARRMGYTQELALVLNNLAHIAYMVKRDLATGKKYLEESLELARATGFQWALSLSVYGLARAAGAGGDIETARQGFEEAAEIGRKLGNRQMVCASRSELAHVLREHGEIDEPLAIYKEVILSWLDLGHRAAVAHELECMAFIFRRNGRASYRGRARLMV
jgi:predicted ATPase